MPNITGTPKGLDSAISTETSSKSIDQIASYLDDLLKELEKTKSYKTTSKERKEMLEKQIKSLEKQRDELSELQKTFKEVMKNTEHLTPEQQKKYQKEFQKELLDKFENLEKISGDMDSISAFVVDKTHKAGRDFQKTLDDMKTFMKGANESFESMKKVYTRNQEIDDARKKLKEQLLGTPEDREKGFLGSQGMMLLQSATSAFGPFKVLFDPLFKNFSLLTTAFSKKRSPTESDLLKNGGSAGAAAVYSTKKVVSAIEKSSDDSFISNLPTVLMNTGGILSTLGILASVVKGGLLAVTIGTIAASAAKTWWEYETGEHDPGSKGAESGDNVSPLSLLTVPGELGSTFVWGAKEGFMNNWDSEHPILSFAPALLGGIGGSLGATSEYSAGFWGARGQDIKEGGSLGEWGLGSLLIGYSNALTSINEGFRNIEDAYEWAHATGDPRYQTPIYGQILAIQDYNKFLEEQENLLKAEETEQAKKILASLGIGITGDPATDRKNFLEQTNDGNEMFIRDAQGNRVPNPNYRTGLEFLSSPPYNNQESFVPLDEVISQSTVTPQEVELASENVSVISEDFENNLFVTLNELIKKTSGGSVTNTFTLTPNFDFSTMRL